MPALSASLDELAAETTWLRRLARSLVHDAAAADDLVQDTYVVAAARAPSDGRPLRPWLVRVLVNLTRMRSRGARHRSARELAVADIAAAPATPAELVGRIELHRLLAGLVLELSPASRDVVLLHYVEGLTSAEIANRLGIAAGTVRWRLKQALDELRAQLDHKEPNRAWLPALAAFAGPDRAAGVVVPWLAVAALALVLGAVWLVYQARATAAPIAVSPTPHAPIAALAGQAPSLAPGSAPPGHGAAPGAPTSGPRTVTVTGNVVDTAQRPVEGAEVTLDCRYGEGGDPLPHTRTSARGSFAFEIDRACTGVVAATKDDLLGVGDVYTLPRPIAIVLAPKVMLPVRVVDAETGAPIEGAVVATASRSAAAFRNTATTDHDGQAQLALPAPPRIGPPRLEMFGDVIARAPGRIPAVARPDHDDNARAPRTRTLRLERGIAVRGHLVGGAPFTGASLDIVGPMADNGPVGDGIGWTRRKGADAEPVATDGSFELRVRVPGRYWLAPHAPGLAATTEAETKVDVGPDGRSDIVLHVGASTATGVAGVVVDPTGAPVAGAIVTAPSGMKPIVTDAHGQFAIPMGAGPYQIVVHAGALASEIVRLDMHHGQLLHLTIPLGPAGIAGTVVDRGGTPVAGAEVWRNAMRGWNIGERAITDAAGHFAFDVPRGDFVLSVRRTSDDDFEDDDDVHVAGGTHDARLVVP